MPQTRPATPLTPVPADAAEQALRAHESAARVAEQAGFLKDARGHRELVVQLRRAALRSVDVAPKTASPRVLSSR